MCDFEKRAKVMLRGAKVAMENKAVYGETLVMLGDELWGYEWDYHEGTARVIEPDCVEEWLNRTAHINTTMCEDEGL